MSQLTPFRHHNFPLNPGLTQVFTCSEGTHFPPHTPRAHNTLEAPLPHQHPIYLTFFSTSPPASCPLSVIATTTVKKPAPTNHTFPHTPIPIAVL